MCRKPGINQSSAGALPAPLGVIDRRHVDDIDCCRHNVYFFTFPRRSRLCVSEALPTQSNTSDVIHAMQDLMALRIFIGQGCS